MERRNNGLLTKFEIIPQRLKQPGYCGTCGTDKSVPFKNCGVFINLETIGLFCRGVETGDALKRLLDRPLFAEVAVGDDDFAREAELA